MLLSTLEVQDGAIFDFVTNGVLSVDGSGNVGTSTGVVGSTYTPSFTNQVGVTSLTLAHAYYTRSLDTVTLAISLTLTNGLLGTNFDCSLPVARTGNFADANQFIANATTYNNALTAITSSPIIQSNSGAQTFKVTFPSLSLGTWNLRINATYNVAN